MLSGKYYSGYLDWVYYIIGIFGQKNQSSRLKSISGLFHQSWKILFFHKSGLKLKKELAAEICLLGIYSFNRRWWKNSYKNGRKQNLFTLWIQQETKGIIGIWRSNRISFTIVRQKWSRDRLCRICLIYENYLFRFNILWTIFWHLILWRRCNKTEM